MEGGGVVGRLWSGRVEEGELASRADGAGLQ